MQLKSTLSLFLLSCVLIFIHCKKEPVEPPKSSAAKISKLELEADGVSYTTFVNGTDIKLNNQLPIGTEQVSIKTLSLSANATANRKEGDVLKFDESPISIVVTAEDGTRNTFSLVLEQVEKPSINLVANVDTVKPYQLVSISADNYTFSADQYEGSFGSQSFPIGVTEENELVFLMPEVPAKKEILKLSIDGFEYEELEFTILELEDLTMTPEEFFDERLIVPVENFAEELQTLLRNNSAQGDIEDLELLVNMLSDFKSEIQEIPEEDKISLSNFFLANSEIFDFDYSIPEFNDTFSVFRNETQDLIKKMRNDAAFLVILTGTAFITYQGLNILLVSPDPWTKFLAIPVAIALLGEALYIKHVAIEILGTAFKIGKITIAKVLEINLRTSTLIAETRNNSLEFNHDKATEITFNGNFETLSESDANSSSSIIQELYNGIKKVSSFINSVKAILGKAKNLFGIGNSDLKGNEPIFNNLSKEYLIYEEYLTIQNLSNENVLVEKEKIPNGFRIKVFNTSDETQEFTFDIHYKNQALGTELTTTFNATVTASDVEPTCMDGIKNGDETGIDCGGNCSPCIEPNCSDGIKNGDEEGVDCGGSCQKCLEGIVYFQSWNKSEEKEYLLQLNLMTGLYETVGPMDGVSSKFGGSSSFDPINKRFYFTGKGNDDNSYLFVIDANNGQVFYRWNVDNFDGFTYSGPSQFQTEPGTNIVYFMSWHKTEEVEYLFKLDISSGEYKRIGAMHGVANKNGGSSSYDPINKRFSFMGGGKDDNNYLFVVNSVNGEVIYKWDRNKFDLFTYNGALQFEPEPGTDIIYFQSWHRSEEVEYLFKLNISTGNYERIGAMHGVASKGFGTSSYDPIKKRFLFAGGGKDNNSYMYVIDSNTGEVSYKWNKSNILNNSSFNGASHFEPNY